MKKVISILFLIFSFNSQAMSPNEMYVIIGAIKYYNESCSGLNLAGVQRMNKGLKRYKMDKTPIHSRAASTCYFRLQNRKPIWLSRNKN